MPDRQLEALSEAFGEYRRAVDPGDEWANSRLATVIRAAEDAGWSRRAVAAALKLSRERCQRIAKFPAAASYPMPRCEPGVAFPDAAVAAFRKAEDEVRRRRLLAERDLAATLGAAHKDAGWPYNVLGAMLGASGERLRQIAESDVDLTGAKARKFAPFTRLLKERAAPAPRGSLDEATRERLRLLAESARKATKAVGTRLGPAPKPEEIAALKLSLAARQASEELSALLIKLKKLNVPWPELDAACGYRPGGARRRAIRHGYAETPPSMKAYTPTPGHVRTKSRSHS